MRIYDTTFIVNPQTDDASIDRQVRAISDLIANNGGKILDENRMGTRRLAYPIDGLTQGYYTTIIFKGPMGILPALDRHFHLGEAYIRHITILFGGDAEVFAEREETAAETEEKGQEVKPAAAETVEKRAKAAEATDSEAGAEEEKTPAASAESTESAEPEPAEKPEEAEEEEEL